MRRSAFRFLVITSLFLRLAFAETRPKYGGVLTVEIHDSITLADPTAWPAQLVPLVYDRLAHLDDRGQPQPGLAVSWQSDVQNRRWLFRLRGGVKFHDGTPVTAAAVAASLKDLGHATRAGEDVVAIESEAPVPNMAEQLAAARFAILRRGPDGVTVGTGPFRITQWEPGKRAVLAANEDYWGGRPYLDSIGLQMGRTFRVQSIDLELGKADVIELPIEDLRAATQRGMRTWTSAPADIMALVFDRGHSAAEIARVREAIALAIDRNAIHNVLLQRQGEPTAALLPNWLTGYAFLFPAAQEMERARQFMNALTKPGPRLSLSFDPADPLARPIAERVALNAREAGIQIQPAAGVKGDVRLVRLRLASSEPARALAGFAAVLGLSDLFKPPADVTPEALYASERSLLEDFRVVPLFHLPEIAGLGPRVRNWAPQRWGDWRLDGVWLEARTP